MAYEADLQRDLMAWLKRHGIEHWRMPIGPVVRGGGKVWSSNPLKGFPDVAGLCTKKYPGRFWALELKSTVGKVSSDQAAWLARLKMGGAAVAVIRNMGDAILFFKALGELD